jgi:hypothetical protein
MSAAIPEARVSELIDLVQAAVADGSSEEPLVVGQRVLFALIPFVEPLATSGPSRRQLLVSLVEAASLRSNESSVRFALQAVHRALELRMDEVLVAALQDTEMLSRGAGGCGACLLSVFNSYFRLRSPRSPASPAAPGDGVSA